MLGRQRGRGTGKTERRAHRSLYLHKERPELVEIRLSEGSSIVTRLTGRLVKAVVGGEYTPGLHVPVHLGTPQIVIPVGSGPRRQECLNVVKRAVEPRDDDPFLVWRVGGNASDERFDAFRLLEVRLTID